MLKRLLTYLAIGLLGLQIPVMISLWPSLKLASSINRLETEIKTAFADEEPGAKDVIDQVQETIEPLKEGITEAAPTVANFLDRIGTVISQFREGIKRSAGMFWGSILLSLLLAAALYFLNKAKFFRNLGTSAILGGAFSLLNALGLQNSLITNFPTTFDYFYNKIVEAYPSFGIPLVRAFFERFSPDVFKGFAQEMISRNVLWGVLAILAGLASWFAYRWFGRSKKTPYMREEKERKPYYEKKEGKHPYCTQGNIDTCRRDCKDRYKNMNNRQCEEHCIDKFCSHKTCEEFKDRTKKE